MRVLVQRVTRASVRIGDETAGQIGPGLLLFVGVSASDTAEELELLTTKVLNLRIFEDEDGRMNHSLLDLAVDDDASAAVLVISQFTLYGDVRKGRRPSFTRAAPPDVAGPMVQRFVERLAAPNVTVEQGRFGAEMAVELINDGPVTIWLDSEDLAQPRRST